MWNIRKELWLAAGVGAVLGLFIFLTLVIWQLSAALAQRATASKRPVPTVAAAETAAEMQARIEREARTALGGKMAEWNAASDLGQQHACLLAVARTHPDEPAERQLMLARLIWAQTDFVLEDSPLPGATVAQTIALIDTFDYQPKTPAAQEPVRQHEIVRSISRLLQGRPAVEFTKGFKYRALDPDKMAQGELGTFAVIRVDQVVADDTFLATVDDGQSVIFTRMSTAELSDGRMLSGRDLPVEVLGPIGYQTVVGGSKTVLLVKPLDAASAAKNAHRFLSESEWNRRTGRVSPITGR